MFPYQKVDLFNASRLVRYLMVSVVICVRYFLLPDQYLNKYQTSVVSGVLAH